MPLLHPVTLTALILALFPVFAFGLAGERIASGIARLPRSARLALPAIFVLPYLIATLSAGDFHPGWCLLYLLVPPGMAGLETLAASLDPKQQGHWLDALVLLPLGLAVDLRLLQPAWPQGTAVIGKLILLDSALYAILGLRRLTGVGFDLHLRLGDLKTGLREFLFYAPLAIPIGLALHFLALHRHVAHPRLVAPLWLFSFLAVALPEEIFFRGWIQNLLERRIGPRWALFLTSALFGLSHFNKRSGIFNWQYVILAALAGVFYGRAWRQNRRIGASAICHATVDTIWGALFWRPY
jgi:membrane protease YdiL (CAAX protease family)